MNMTMIREALEGFWSAREPRERWILGIGGAMLLASLLYLGIWRPAMSASADLEEKVESRQELVTWLRGAAAEAEALRQARGGSVASGPLQDRVEAAAREAGLGDGLARLTMEGEGRVRADLEGAAFRRTTIWLQGLEHRQGLRPVRVRLERTDQPGRVDGRLILEEG